MIINFFSTARRDEEFEENIIERVREVILNHQFVGSTFLNRFELNFSSHFNARYSVGVGNGLDALKAILFSLEVSEKDEIIVPANTFAATWLAVTSVGATPVAVDIDPNTGNMDYRKIESKITKNTKAVIVVHLYGIPARISEIKKICDEKKLFLIEDCAQSHGAKVNDKFVGTFGIASAFSFYPTKNLGALGDGGLVLTSSTSLAAKVRVVANYGKDPLDKQKYLTKGFNSRLDPIQANILDFFLEKLPVWNERRRYVADRYIEICQENSAINIVRDIENQAQSVWHHFLVRVQKRDHFRNYLLEKGIETDIHYEYPVYKLKIFKNFNKGVNFKLADEFCHSIVSIPMHPWLAEEEISFIADMLAKYRE